MRGSADNKHNCYKNEENHCIIYMGRGERHNKDCTRKARGK